MAKKRSKHVHEKVKSQEQKRSGKIKSESPYGKWQNQKLKNVDE